MLSSAGAQTTQLLHDVFESTVPLDDPATSGVETRPTAAVVQPNTETEEQRFYFEQDDPLTQVTVSTAPKIGDNEAEKYLPEFDPDAPRTVLDIESYTPSGYGSGTTRGWPGRLYAWDAPNFYHRPLYFEQPNLERYGHFHKSWRLQSAISAAHFFAAIPAVPVKMCIDKPCERVYTLGHFRPGNCNPNYWYKLK
jgi:hypothetical protein